MGRQTWKFTVDRLREDDPEELREVGCSVEEGARNSLGDVLWVVRCRAADQQSAQEKILAVLRRDSGWEGALTPAAD